MRLPEQGYQRHARGLSPRGRLIVIAILLALVCSILTWNYVVTGPMTRRARVRIRTELQDLAPYPTVIANKFKFGDSRKGGTALITADYCANATRDAVVQHYEKQAEAHGWMLTRASTTQLAYRRSDDTLTIDLPQPGAGPYCYTLRLEWVE